MKTQRTSLMAIIFIAFFAHSYAQVQTPKYVSTTGNSGGFYEYLPSGYWGSGQTYPLIVFIHGVGELGDGVGQLSSVLNGGLPRVISSGQFPSSFNVGGVNQGFLVISPQFRNWPSNSDVNDVINYAIQNYRVNTSRIYVTGLSMGGGVTWETAAAYASRIAAIVPVCGASYPEQNRAKSIASANVAVWATHNDYDGTVPSFYTKDYVSYISQAGGNAKKTIWGSASHDAWSQTYDPNFRENGLNIYEWMLQYQKGGWTPPPTTPTPTPTPTVSVIPGKVEAESYSSMSGVQTEYTQDAGGGQNVGWIDPSDWMDYNVNVTATGSYTVNFRIATTANNAQFQLKKADGTVLATVNVPNTWGYQFWQTVSATVNLSAGTQTLRIISSSPWGSVWNINWADFSFNNSPSAIPVPTPPTTGTSTKIEAENYSSMSGIQTEWTQDAGGGQNVGWIDQWDWMNYSYNAPSSGTYTVNLRVATPNNGAQLQLTKGDASLLATVNVPNTWGYQAYQTISTTINLSAGQQTIRVQSSSGAVWNINWLEIVSSSSATTPSTPTTGTSTKIEAESYSSMSGVQTEYTQDAGGGQNVGWIDRWDWMDYSYNAPSSGTYTVNLRVASPNNGAQLQLTKPDGTLLSTVNVPNTGGYQSYQTVSTTINLSAGQQTIRVQSSSGAVWNINWLEIMSSSSATTPSTPTTGTSTKIEAENYSSMSGIQTEWTQDAGGGQNVGWIDQWDWMNYSYNAPSSGTYTVNLRVATPNNGAQLQLTKGDATLLATVNVPNTGGYQSYQTVSTTINLSAGQQTIRVQSSSGAMWNINWLEIVSSGSSYAMAQRSSAIMSTETTGSAAASLSIFPNPVQNRFVLQLNNELSGPVNVQIFNLEGALQKQFTLNKTTAGSTQFYLSIGELAKANYIIKATMKEWNESKQISKQ